MAVCVGWAGGWVAIRAAVMACVVDEGMLRRACSIDDVEVKGCCACSSASCDDVVFWNGYRDNASATLLCSPFM